MSTHIIEQGSQATANFYNDIDIGFCIIEVAFDAPNRQADYRFLEVNSAFEEHTGLIDVTGRWMRNLAPDHEQFWFDRYGNIARTGRPARFEYSAQALGVVTSRSTHTVPETRAAAGGGPVRGYQRANVRRGSAKPFST